MVSTVSKCACIFKLLAAVGHETKQTTRTLLSGRADITKTVKLSLEQRRRTDSEQKASKLQCSPQRIPVSVFSRHYLREHDG